MSSDNELFKLKTEVQTREDTRFKKTSVREGPFSYRNEYSSENKHNIFIGARQKFLTAIWSRYRRKKIYSAVCSSSKWFNRYFLIQNLKSSFCLSLLRNLLSFFLKNNRKFRFSSKWNCIAQILPEKRTWYQLLIILQQIYMIDLF